jgi:hypothetical protein
VLATWASSFPTYLVRAEPPAQTEDNAVRIAHRWFQLTEAVHDRHNSAQVAASPGMADAPLPPRTVTSLPFYNADANSHDKLHPKP